MTSRHRNRGIVQLVFALILTVLQLILFVKARRHLVGQNEGLLIFFTYLGSVTLWMLGSYNLAKSKGYDGHTIGGVFFVLLFVGSCIPMAALLFPAVVLFGLPDKTRVPRHWRPRDDTAAYRR